MAMANTPSLNASNRPLPNDRPPRGVSSSAGTALSPSVRRRSQPPWRQAVQSATRAARAPRSPIEGDHARRRRVCHPRAAAQAAWRVVQQRSCLTDSLPAVQARSKEQPWPGGRRLTSPRHGHPSALMSTFPTVSRARCARRAPAAADPRTAPRAGRTGPGGALGFGPSAQVMRLALARCPFDQLAASSGRATSVPDCLPR